MSPALTIQRQRGRSAVDVRDEIEHLTHADDFDGAGAGMAANAVRTVGSRMAAIFSEDVAAGRISAWRATGGGPVGNDNAPLAPSYAVSSFNSAPDWRAGFVPNKPVARTSNRPCR